MSETVVVPSHHVDSHHQRAVALITMAHGFSHFYQILLPSLFVFIAPALELTYTQLGVMITLFYLASGVGQVICGFAVDRLGARKLLLFGMTLIAGAHLAAGWSTGFSALALCAFLAGVGNSVFHPADFTLLNQLVRGKRLAWAFSLHGVGGNLGYALSPVFAITAAGVFGWQVALQLVGGLGLLVALALFLEPSIRTTDSTARTEKRT
jgi:MFS family permease